MARIVLVGSEGEVRGAISTMLAEQKIAVTTANDLADAIARVTALDEPPDLVLLDRALAGGREGELIDCIRARTRLQDVPLVLYAVQPPPSSSGVSPIESMRDAFDAKLVLAIVQAICG